MERFDAAVIGAGPAGSSTAISLARKGYSVVLLDKRLFPREKLCGDFLNPINWPLFERLGVAEELLSLEHEEITGFRISSASGPMTTIRFPPRNGRRTFGLGLRRFHLDELLLRRAEREGAVVREGCRVNDISRRKDGWFIKLSRHAVDEVLQSTLVVGADGRNSWVARRLGVAQTSESFGESLAFQMHLRGVKGVGKNVQIHLYPGGYAGIVGLGGGMTNLCFTVEKSRFKTAASVEVLLEDCLYKNSHLREALGESEIVGDVRSAYPLYFPPRRCYGESFLLVGDAARVTEPVTGEGIYFALRSGELAAGTADLAFRRGRFSARQLSSYRQDCRRVFSVRQRVNALIRTLVHRPRLLCPLIRLSRKTEFPVHPLVRYVCGMGVSGDGRAALADVV